MQLEAKVNIQRSEGVAALGIPRERMEAIAQEIALTGMTDSHWSKQRSYTVALAYEWGPTPLVLFVRKDDLNFEVTFVLDSEVKQQGFRQADKE